MRWKPAVGIAFDLAARLDISSASLQRNIGSMTDSTDIVRRSTILIVDDEPPNVSLLERILKREGFTALISTTEPRAALSRTSCRSRSSRSDDARSGRRNEKDGEPSVQRR
ncbi:hypothetical protein [Rhizobium leguminosarum]|uniref:hypothetical protein n=1 Tax=Rhizobium leguminosarum TaxID=384 RepID=UPI003D6F2287